MNYSAQGIVPCAFVQRMRAARSLFELAAMGAAGDLARADKGSLLRQGKVRNAMAGSPDAVVSRNGMTRDSLSPSCSWLSGLAENHERKIQCLICIELNSIGVDAS
jgi:hypothetical protein